MKKKKKTYTNTQNSMLKTDDDDDDDDDGDNDSIYNDYDVDNNAPEIQGLAFSFNIYSPKIYKPKAGHSLPNTHAVLWSAHSGNTAVSALPPSLSHHITVIQFSNLNTSVYQIQTRLQIPTQWIPH